MNQSLMQHFTMQIEDLRKLAWTFLNSRKVWWESNFGTIYLDHRQQLDAIDWMVLEGNRCIYRDNFGSYIDTMLHTLDTFEWIRWGNYPRRCQFKQRFTPKGDFQDWQDFPYIEPKIRLINKKFKPRIEYAPIAVDEFDPIQEAS